MWLGDFPEDFTAVTCMFTTHASTGAPVAPSTAFEAADVLIYKNGNAAQKTTTNGVTMTSPFDAITGLHTVTIDTSNDTGDTGFWVSGAVYTLVLSPDETVDGVAVAKVIGQFGIELYGALRPTTLGRRLDVTATGEAGLDFDNTAGTLSKGTDITGFNDLDAAGVRTAVGLAAANLDTQLDAIPTAVENADALLNRDMSTGTDSGSATVRTPRQALRFLRNKWTISGGSLTVTKEDDSTTSWSGSVTENGAQNAVSSIDPAGP